MNKLNFFGIGPIIGRIAISWLVLAIFFSIKFKGTFTYIEDGTRIFFYAGLAFLITGLLIYFLTLPLLLKGLKETRLVITGCFYLCCNPLYCAIILFIIPGISFIMNSWLVLTASIVAYILFKFSIKKEYAEMEKFFGDEYRNYRANTPEFFPFPVKKWYR
jgi:protein-S-isoprenylcysteine O-methyltransferase Ste14